METPLRGALSTNGQQNAPQRLGQDGTTYVPLEREARPQGGFLRAHRTKRARHRRQTARAQCAGAHRTQGSLGRAALPRPVPRRGVLRGLPQLRRVPRGVAPVFFEGRTARGNKCGASAMVQALPHTGPQRGEEQNTRPKLQRKHRRPRCVPFRPGVASACVISALLVPWPSFLSFSFSLLPGSFAALGHLRSRQPHPGCSPYGTTRCPSDHLDI